MAWTSPETKMDTGQLYVTTDGEHYTPVTEVSINGVEFIPVESPSQRAERERLLKLREIPLTIDIKLNADWLPMQLDIYNYCVNDVKTATEMLELQERIEAAQAEIKRIEHEERKKKISHLAYILTMLGTNPDLSIEKRKWCCDELAFKHYNVINHNAVCKINYEKETKKMNARKCERCGKLYEVTEWPSTVEAGDENLNRTPVRFKYMELPPEMMASLNESGLAKQQTLPITISKVLQPTRYESKTESVTLCPHCLNSLKDWFEMKTETITKEAET